MAEAQIGIKLGGKSFLGNAPYRHFNAVMAKIFDRNAKPNQEAESAVDKIRDTLVGVAGLTGFSKLQWKGLVAGLIAQ
jgi:hypothetical protein